MSPAQTNRAVHSICVESGKVRTRLNHLESHKGVLGSNEQGYRSSTGQRGPNPMLISAPYGPAVPKNATYGHLN